MHRRHLLAAAASLAAVPAALRAQSGPWPHQPIKL
jgi:hypothetical protein